MLRNVFNRARPQMQPGDMKMNGMIDDFRRVSMMRQPRTGQSMETAWRSSGPTTTPQMMRDPRARMNAQHAMHMRQAMMYQQQMAMMSRPMMMPMNTMVRPPPPVVQRATTQSNVTTTSTTEHGVQNEDASALQRTAGQVADMLKEKSDPKFKNSEFVNFMSKVKTGEVRIKDNIVTESTGSSKEMEGVSSSNEKLLPWYQSAMDAAKQTEGMPLGDRMESAWRDALNGKVTMETAWKRTFCV